MFRFIQFSLRNLRGEPLHRRGESETTSCTYSRLENVIGPPPACFALHLECFESTVHLLIRKQLVFFHWRYTALQRTYMKPFFFIFSTVTPENVTLDLVRKPNSVRCFFLLPRKAEKKPPGHDDRFAFVFSLRRRQAGLGAQRNQLPLVRCAPYVVAEK